MTTPTDHNDSVSGQPYSPPPWDPNHLPPPSPPSVPDPGISERGGDGGGGKKKHRKWPWIVGALAVLFTIGGIAGGNSGDPAPKVAAPTATQAPYPTPPPEQKEANASASRATKAPPAPTATVAPAPKPKPKLTAGQEQAIGAAQDYLDFQHFSRTGLIKQLEFDKYSKADATFAVDHITVNWNAQAAGAAKDYLSFEHFSRAGLIDQLIFDGFTKAQAVYAVNKAGL